jgi:hypothetical protein
MGREFKDTLAGLFVEIASGFIQGKSYSEICEPTKQKIRIKEEEERRRREDIMKNGTDREAGLQICRDLMKYS